VIAFWTKAKNWSANGFDYNGVPPAIV